MKEIVTIFQNNRDDIKTRLFKAINKIELNSFNKSDLKQFFPIFNSLKDIYVVDSNYNQITPVYTESIDKSDRVDKVVKSLQNSIKLDENGEYMSSVYRSGSDGEVTITTSKRMDSGKILTMNFNLIKLLEELNYINKAEFFNKFTKLVYAFIGYSLTVFATILIFYAIFNFLYHVFDDGVNIFQSIFKSTIALTLGLAIFDLAKNLLEHEVVYKEYFIESHGSRQLLEKFLISIIIALSIESLMTVFKIAISDYKDMIYAVYLLLAISVLIFALSYLNKNVKSS